MGRLEVVCTTKDPQKHLRQWRLLHPRRSTIVLPLECLLALLLKLFLLVAVDLRPFFVFTSSEYKLLGILCKRDFLFWKASEQQQEHYSLLPQYKPTIDYAYIRLGELQLMLEYIDSHNHYFYSTYWIN